MLGRTPENNDAVLQMYNTISSSQKVVAESKDIEKIKTLCDTSVPPNIGNHTPVEGNENNEDIILYNEWNNIPLEMNQVLILSTKSSRKICVTRNNIIE